MLSFSVASQFMLWDGKRRGTPAKHALSNQTHADFNVEGRTTPVNPTNTPRVQTSVQNPEDRAVPSWLIAREITVLPVVPYVRIEIAMNDKVVRHLRCCAVMKRSTSVSESRHGIDPDRTLEHHAHSDPT
jgi:hypothetical protein